MNEKLYERVRQNPKFVELVSKRSSFAWKLSVAMLVAYYAFILVIAFSPTTLGIKLGAGVTTVGIPVGVAIIIFAFVLTGIYVKRANTEFDDLTAQIKQDAFEGGK